MKITRSTGTPARTGLSYEERWRSDDKGLIACWEAGIEFARQNPNAVEAAKRGELIILPWKGGVDKKLKSGRKFGTFNYLAMFQGVCGTNLEIDTEKTTVLTCSKYGVKVQLTYDLELLEPNK